MKEIRLLWVDQEHPEIWSATIKFLEITHGFKVLMVNSFNDEKILDNCRDKDVFVVHCGTYEPVENIKELLESIKNEYPNIKIGLESNAIHPHLENIVDFYINKPIDDDELQQLVKDQIIY